ncbi:MAG: helix-turn-helix domain-containing protein [Pirellulales bacterium]|nr:helix-turn-helix domain-containing protein [Pirellulales bacterium]
MPRVSSSPPLHDVGILHGANVRRLMARMNMTLNDVVEATGLDERTVRSILRDASRPHARTLHKLAEGLEASTDELFQAPSQASPEETYAAAFDRATNPIVTEVIDAEPQLFERWAPEDFDELYSRVAVGGELTTAGVLAAAEAMNARRELMYQVAVILESNEADLMREFVKVLFRRVTDVS